MWNKAYNISVQMASVSNKYLAIIDAIDYGMRANRERPHNINLLYAIGSVYGDKLGDSAEKSYYTRRVRAESLPHESRQKLAENDPGYRRLELDAVLDAQGRVLEKHLVPSSVLLTSKDRPSERYDGSELQFLKQFEPYPYGLAPHAFAYSYRKRCQLLQRLGAQTHAQLAELVIDSRPGSDLREWSESEWELARRCEVEALGRPVPSERPRLELATAGVGPDAVIDSSKLALARQALFGYTLGARLATTAAEEYLDHLRKFTTNFQLYESHREELLASQALLSADRDYLAAILEAPSGAQRDSLLASSREQYRRALARYSAQILRYHLPEEIAQQTFPQGVTRANFGTTLGANLETLDPGQIMPLLNASLAALESSGVVVDEITEMYPFVRRCSERLEKLPRS
jgi:hypothetical protein